ISASRKTDDGHASVAFGYLARDQPRSLESPNPFGYTVVCQLETPGQLGDRGRLQTLLRALNHQKDGVLLGGEAVTLADLCGTAVEARQGRTEIGCALEYG